MCLIITINRKLKLRFYKALKNILKSDKELLEKCPKHEISSEKCSIILIKLILSNKLQYT